VLDTPYTAPQTPVQELLSQVWREILGLDEIGIYDDFLELGGNSLLATQVLARVISDFQVEVPLRDFLAAPTLAALAAALIEREPTPGSVTARARLRRQIQGMSTAEIQERLDARRQPGPIPAAVAGPPSPTLRAPRAPR
jgi:hypothetical protein